MAQLVEHEAVNLRVLGSIPSGSVAHINVLKQYGVRDLNSGHLLC